MSRRKAKKKIHGQPYEKAMVHLIAGFLIPQSGSITYMAEGERMHGIPKMGYLMQDGFLFDESIQANIRIANAQLI
ncbi:hypothetical protein [Romboutsia ilealis]|uniref:hypothetical protein n=1 Tax=Romboutsia ilealis TaxID=1115758 RepID=UPI00272B3F37|nr:hypothetical protein [Romboutsia ilealis]